MTASTNEPTIEPKEKLTIEEILHKQRLSIDDLVRCGKDGLEAQKIIRDRYGNEVGTEPDFPTRHKFFASFLELLGYMKKDTNITVGVNNMSPEEKEWLAAYKRTPSTSGVSIGREIS